jgi:predicted RNase H-like HicB family nuclease
MSKESKNSGKRKRSAKSWLNRPFAADILAQARKVAQHYQIVVSYEDGEYYGRGVELPGAGDDGKTPAECISNTREALVTMVAYLLEQGETPPAPASEEKRDQQINVRLSSKERLLLETKAHQSGAAGISEYIRAVALAK